MSKTLQGPARRVWGGAVRTIVAGTLLAVLSYGLVFLWEVKNYPSSFQAFRQITLIMSRAEVNSILRQHGKGNCEKSPCEFADFWRVYTLTFDPTGRLVSKSFYFKTRQGFWNYLLQRHGPGSLADRTF